MSTAKTGSGGPCSRAPVRAQPRQGDQLGQVAGDGPGQPDAQQRVHHRRRIGQQALELGVAPVGGGVQQGNARRLRPPPPGHRRSLRGAVAPGRRQQ